MTGKHSTEATVETPINVGPLTLQPTVTTCNATPESSSASLPGSNHAEQPTSDEATSKSDTDEG